MRDISSNRWATAIAAALILASGIAPSARADAFPPLNSPASDLHKPGKFVWADLFTSEPETAAKFYCALFDWTAAPHEQNDREYIVLANHNRPVAGVVARFAGKSRRPGRWIPYVSVTDLAAALSAAASAGGKELAPAHNFPDRGMQAIYSDNEGSPVGIIQSSSGDSADNEPQTGDWNWFELLARKPTVAVTYYQATFGYTTAVDTRTEKKSHYLLSSGDLARAGVAPIPDQPEAKPGWLGFVRVENLDGTVARIAALGGEVLVAPRAAALGSRSAVIADPTGGAVGLVEYVNNENPANRP